MFLWGLQFSFCNFCISTAVCRRLVSRTPNLRPRSNEIRGHNSSCTRQMYSIICSYAAGVDDTDFLRPGTGKGFPDAPGRLLPFPNDIEARWPPVLQSNR